MRPLRSSAGLGESVEHCLGNHWSSLDAVGREKTAETTESTHLQDDESLVLRLDEVHPGKEKPEVFGGPEGELEGGGRRGSSLVAAARVDGGHPLLVLGDPPVPGGDLPGARLPG